MEIKINIRCAGVAFTNIEWIRLRMEIMMHWMVLRRFPFSNSISLGAANDSSGADLLFSFIRIKINWRNGWTRVRLQRICCDWAFTDHGPLVWRWKCAQVENEIQQKIQYFVNRFLSLNLNRIEVTVINSFNSINLKIICFCNLFTIRHNLCKYFVLLLTYFRWFELYSNFKSWRSPGATRNVGKIENKIRPTLCVVECSMGPCATGMITIKTTTPNGNRSMLLLVHWDWNVLCMLHAPPKEQPTTHFVHRISIGVFGIPAKVNCRQSRRLVAGSWMWSNSSTTSCLPSSCECVRVCSLAGRYMPAKYEIYRKGKCPLNTKMQV